MDSLIIHTDVCISTIGVNRDSYQIKRILVTGSIPNSWKLLTGQLSATKQKIHTVEIEENSHSFRRYIFRSVVRIKLKEHNVSRSCFSKCTCYFVGITSRTLEFVHYSTFKFARRACTFTRD